MLKLSEFNHPKIYLSRVDNCKNTEFKRYGDDLKNDTNINFNITEQSASIASLNQFTSSAQTAEYYRTLFGIPTDENQTYNLQIKIVSGVAEFTSSIA
jgi:hypothetical protein